MYPIALLSKLCIVGQLCHSMKNCTQQQLVRLSQGLKYIFIDLSDVGAIQAPTIISAGRVDSDPSRVTITWDKTANVLDASIYLGDTFDPVSTLNHSGILINVIL